MSLKFKDPYSFKLWHERLGHPGQNMMCRILTNFIGHNMPSIRIPFVNNFFCEACAKGKLIVRPSCSKVGIESPIFLEWIHGDICGPIHSASGPFRYFMVLIDASTQWPHVCLLSTQNNAFPKFIAKLIELIVHDTPPTPTSRWCAGHPTETPSRYFQRLENPVKRSRVAC